uniref:Uncharacterized protein n=1 Tax=viral metagenome TaxID=1070528 RepID=A0A6C0LDR0_9ZZZZ
MHSLEASCLLSTEFIFKNGQTYSASYTATATGNNIGSAEHNALHECLDLFAIDAAVQTIKFDSIILKTNQTFAVRTAYENDD